MRDKHSSQHDGQKPSNGCQKCAAGKYADQTGQTECTDCEPGKYSSSREANHCEVCPVFTFSQKTGRKSPCTECQYCGGVYCSTGILEEEREKEPKGDLGSRHCPAGYELKGVAALKKTCRMCPHGKYKDGKDGKPCKNCSVERTCVDSLVGNDYGFTETTFGCQADCGTCLSIKLV